MPSLVFSQTALHLPDQRPLIAAFSLTLPPGVTGLVGRNGAGKSSLLAAIADGQRFQSGSIAASSVPRLLAQLAPYQSARIVDLFAQSAMYDHLQLALSGAPVNPNLVNPDLVDWDLVDWGLEERLIACLSDVGVMARPDQLLAQLSGGQQRRAALAAAFFEAPEILLLDEPTNDLDAAGRDLVADLLAGHRGIALVASHDRMLLERVDQIMELGPQGVRLFGGGWREFVRDRDETRARAAAELDRADAATTRTRRALAESAARAARRARQGRAQRDGSQPKLVLNKAKESAEVTGAGQARLAARQIGAAQSRLEIAKSRVDNGKTLGFELPTTGVPAQRLVLRTRGVSVQNGSGPALIDGLDLDLRGADRIRLSGPNGAGKTTLLRLFAGLDAPRCGAVDRPVPAAYLDQRLRHLGRDGRVLDMAQRRLPDLSDQARRALLARFLFRNRDADKPMAGLSGGERLRLGLALALGADRPPPLLLLDEPTNHLDIPAIEAVETALAQYDGALIVVTHDEAFAAALHLNREITIDGNGLRDRRIENVI